MTASSDEAAQLEEGVRATATDFGIRGFQSVDPLGDGPLTFVGPSGREYQLEMKVLDVTGWEDER